MRPLRVTRKRVVVSTLALEEFLTEFSDDMVDAIEAVWEYAYEKKAAENPESETAQDIDEDDEVGHALFNVEIALEALRDLVSPRARVPDGGRHASQVLVGKRAGTITILRRTSREDLEYQAAKVMAAELLGDDSPPEPAEPQLHRPRFPDDDDVEPMLVELLDARHAGN